MIYNSFYNIFKYRCHNMAFSSSLSTVCVLVKKPDISSTAKRINKGVNVDAYRVFCRTTIQKDPHPGAATIYLSPFSSMRHQPYLSPSLQLLTSSSGRSGSRWVKLCRTTWLRSSTTSSFTLSQMFRTLHDDSNISTSCPGLTLCASLKTPRK